MTTRHYDPILGEKLKSDLRAAFNMALRDFPDAICSAGFTEGELSNYHDMARNMDMGFAYLPEILKDRYLKEIPDHIQVCMKCSDFYKSMSAGIPDEEPVM